MGTVALTIFFLLSGLFVLSVYLSSRKKNDE